MKRILRGAALALCLASTGCLSIFPELPKAADPSQARLEKAVKINPSNAHAWFLLGRSHLAGEQTAPARADFQRAVDLQPGFEEAYLGIGVSYLMEEKWDTARAAYERLLAVQPGSAGAWEGIATAELGASRIAEAKDAAEKAIKLDQNSRQGLRILGEVAYIEGRYPEAVAYWNDAMVDGAMSGELEPLVGDLEAYLGRYGRR